MTAPAFVIDDTRPHLGGYIRGGDDATFYPDLWAWLVNEIGVRTVLDVGCGEGHAVQFFHEQLRNYVAGGAYGVTAVGIDGIEQEHPLVTQHDYTTGPIDDPGWFDYPFDLVWCCEFVEHVAEEHVPNFLATFKLAPLVLMTHAEPGQGGWHHVNCQPPGYWIEKMAGIGYTPDPELSARARDLAALNPSPHNHFARSGLAFRKTSATTVVTRPRLHMLGLPHTQTTREHVVCAFTAKLVKFVEMMSDYDIVIYSGEHNDTPCAEHVPLFTDAEQLGWYGNLDPNVLPTVAKFEADAVPWRVMNGRATAELATRLEPGDILLTLAGWAQKPVSDQYPETLVAEWAAGYEGWCSPYVCFESYAWMHQCYGQRNIQAGRFYDTVIPNFFRPEEFQIADTKTDDLLFVGRTIYLKGITVAAQIAAAAGRKLIVAGSGVASHGPGEIRLFDGNVITGDVEYVGPVAAAERNELMGRAHAVFAPTLYVEPFGAVAVEAQLCGTPAITTDWGAYPETVEHGVGGFRFRTLAEGVEAVNLAGTLDPATIRARALERYSLEAIAPRYDRWLLQLDGLRHGGWDALPAE